MVTTQHDHRAVFIYDCEKLSAMCMPSCDCFTLNISMVIFFSQNVIGLVVPLPCSVHVRVAFMPFDWMESQFWHNVFGLVAVPCHVMTAFVPLAQTQSYENCSTVWFSQFYEIYSLQFCCIFFQEICSENIKKMQFQRNKNYLVPLHSFLSFRMLV